MGECQLRLQSLILQKKVIRIMVGLSDQESCRDSFKTLQIMTVPSLYIFSNLMYVRHNIDDFNTMSSIHSYDTRNKNNIVPHFNRLSKSLNSHRYQQYIFFNKLPFCVRQLKISSFKNLLTGWFKERAFYSTEEYMNSNFDDMTCSVNQIIS